MKADGRGIVLGIGIETVGTDAGRTAGFDPPFPNHCLMHGSGKFGLAGLCNLDQLPPTGAVVIAAPLKNCERVRQPLTRDCDRPVDTAFQSSLTYRSTAC
jgi:hypothetical protein